jgi:hypothetical protein
MTRWDWDAYEGRAHSHRLAGTADLVGTLNTRAG